MTTYNVETYQEWLRRGQTLPYSALTPPMEREEKVDSIKFKAHVWKVGTLGTGGLRVMLNLDQEYIKEMAMLAECQHELIELEFQARQSEDEDGALE